MKKLIFLLLAISAAAWFVGISACKKDKWPSGRVLEFGTDKPISGATVTLNECEGEILGSFNCFGVATTKADNDGAFDFKKQDGFAVSAEAQGYWPSGDDFVVLPKDNGCYPPVDLHLFPDAWVKLNLLNQSGSYAFGSSGFSQSILQIPKGDSLTLLKKVEGNREFYLVFHVEDTPNSSITDVNLVHAFDESGTIVPIIHDISFEILLSPIGHDTTTLRVIF